MPCSGEMDERDLWIGRGSRSLNKEFLSALIKKREGAEICCSCRETQRLDVEPGIPAWKPGADSRWCTMGSLKEGGCLV